MSNPFFSIIIPQQNSLHTLHRLFASIPELKDIEILLVDNTPTPVTKEEIGIHREYKLLWSAPERYAGGARNVGIENAKGNWLIFADADDYFTEDAFEAFYSQINATADVIFFGATGIYNDTKEYSDRGEYYTNLVRGFLNHTKRENDIRFGFSSPWSKMVRKQLVDQYHLQYDEVCAANDSFFSKKVGFYAKEVSAIDKIVYVATVSPGSLTQRRDYLVIHSRFLVALNENKFLKQHGLGNYQSSIMRFLYDTSRYYPKMLFKMLGEILSYRQNLFIGCNNWVHTFFSYRKLNKKEKRYITK